MRVISSVPKIKPDYFSIFHRMFVNSVIQANKTLEDKSEINFNDTKKIIFAGVKMINSNEDKSFTYEQLIERFDLISTLNGFISYVTPKQFETIFPIAKEYDGSLYGTKDYFYTRKYIESRGENNLIGENVMEFLWDYQNWDINIFVVNSMTVISDLRRAEGGKGLMEEFAENNGLTTYTLHEISNGKKVLTNNDTGETIQIKKKRPRYLNPL
jgi:hypothetical protein